MKICPICGDAMPEAETFCSSCGYQMNQDASQTQAKTQSIGVQNATPKGMDAENMARPSGTAASVQAGRADAIAAASEACSGSAATAQTDAAKADRAGVAAADAGQSAARVKLDQNVAASATAATAQPVKPAYEPCRAPRPVTPVFVPPASGYMPPTPGSVPPAPGEEQPAGVYGAPQPGYTSYQNNDPVTMGQWLINYLILCVPIANLVMLCIWAFGTEAKPSQRNWARATLIWMGIGVVVSVFLIVVIVVAAVGAFSAFGGPGTMGMYRF